MVQFKRMWSRDSGRFKLIRTIGALPEHIKDFLSFNKRIINDSNSTLPLLRTDDVFLRTFKKTKEEIYKVLSQEPNTSEIRYMIIDNGKDMSVDGILLFHKEMVFTAGLCLEYMGVQKDPNEPNVTLSLRAIDANEGVDWLSRNRFPDGLNNLVVWLDIFKVVIDDTLRSDKAIITKINMPIRIIDALFYNSKKEISFSLYKDKITDAMQEAFKKNGYEMMGKNCIIEIE